jgi:hypothetical protein
MNTTAFGLMSAIPLLLFHARLTFTTGQIVDSLEMASVKALNMISSFNRHHVDAKTEIPAVKQQKANRKPHLNDAKQSDAAAPA